MEFYTKDKIEGRVWQNNTNFLMWKEKYYKELNIWFNEFKEDLDFILNEYTGFKEALEQLQDGLKNLTNLEEIEKQKRWEFLKSYLEKILELKKIYKWWKSELLDVTKKNTKLFLIKSWAKIKFTKNWNTKIITLLNDYITWDWSFLNKDDEGYLPDSNIEIISWKFSELDFSKLENKFDENFFEKLKKYSRIREETSSFII